MTRDQYSGLVQFLGLKFDGIDRQFEKARRHSTALFEQSRGELRIVAEGTNARFERLEERFGSLERTVASLDESARGTLADHEARIQALE